MILDPRNQDLLTFLEQVLLDCANMLNITDVLVEFRVNGHVLSPDCKSFAMLVLVLNVENKRDAGRVFGHHLFDEAHSKMNSLYNERFVALVEAIDDFG